MESRTGRILLLISGILTLVGALFLLIIGLFFAFFSSSFAGGEETEVMIMVVVFLVLFVVYVVAGILKLYASKMMRDPKRTMNGGILGLIVGVLSGFDVLAIVGGILGMVDAGK